MKYIYIIMAIIFTVMVFFIWFPHPYQHLCLYKYETMLENVEPSGFIISYNIIKMPTVCVNINDEGIMKTTRTTIAEGLDTPENRKLFEEQLQILVDQELPK